MPNTKDKQICIRISAEADGWLERRVRNGGSKAMVIRSLIEREMRRGREHQMLMMFNEAAKDASEAERSGQAYLGEAFARFD